MLLIHTVSPRDCAGGFQPFFRAKYQRTWCGQTLQTKRYLRGWVAFVIHRIDWLIIAFGELREYDWLIITVSEFQRIDWLIIAFSELHEIDWLIIAFSEFKEIDWLIIAFREF